MEADVAGWSEAAGATVADSIEDMCELSPLILPMDRSEDDFGVDSGGKNSNDPLQNLAIIPDPVASQATGSKVLSADNRKSSHKRSHSDSSASLLLSENLKDSTHTTSSKSALAVPTNAATATALGEEEAQTKATSKSGVTFARDLPRSKSGNFTASLQQETADRQRRYSSSSSGGGGGGGQQQQQLLQQSSPSWTPAAGGTATARGRVRIYRSCINQRGPEKLTTRDIAALDFLLGIPLEAEESIVQHGWMLQQRREKAYHHHDDTSDDENDDLDDTTMPHLRDEQPLEPPGSVAGGGGGGGGPATTAQLGSNSYHGRWWEKWVPREQNLHNKINSNNNSNSSSKHKDAGELELPTASGITMTTADGTPSTLGTATLSGDGESKRSSAGSNVKNNNMPPNAAPAFVPGRRLEGDEAILVQIPLKIDTVTRQKSIARQAAIREWEVKVAHGLPMKQQQQQQQQQGTSSDGARTPNQQQQQHALLDGRLFLSASGSYPIGVFSLKRYEPKREEAALRRQKLEARGGGGSHFVMPSRDWRGISFRALLPRKAEQARNQKAFNRFLRNNRPRPPKKKKSRRKQRRSSNKSNLSSGNLLDDSDMDIRSSDEEDSKEDDNDDNSGDESDSDNTLSSSSSGSSEDSYIPGILDDPEMTLGRHRNVMIGDCVTGCIVASTIQFVKPALLKADLNQKFRERFDGWEPGKSQRKYIGARVVDGVYTLIDPCQEETTGQSDSSNRHDGTSSPPPAATPAIIRMPPSLTLSKIRSAKRQALMAFAKANLEIGTAALACVYFERLCLSCRVDKSNRRLCFASCLLLASKINEPNEVLVMKEETNNNTSGAESGEDAEAKRNTNARKKIKRLQSSIRPNKRSSTMFASLLEFFTQDWSLSLKHLYAAEWGVFAALRFSLHATPSQVAFHFKRLMKTLGWNPRHYLGKQMYAQWQDALAAEESRVVAREKRREVRQVRKERRLQRELQKEVIRGKQLVEKETLLRRKSSGTKITSVAFNEERSELSQKGVMKIANKKSKPARVDAKGPGTPEVSQSEEMPLGKGRNSGPKTKSQQFYLAALPGSPKRERLSLPATAALVGGGTEPPRTPTLGSVAPRKPRQRKLLSVFGGIRKSSSTDKLTELNAASGQDVKEDRDKAGLGLPNSPSMPMIAQAASFPGLHENDTEKPEPSDTSIANNPNESVFIDMPDTPPRPAGERLPAVSDDEEKGALDDDDLGIVI